MENYHHCQLTIYNNPAHFFLYDLMAVEKVNRFIYHDANYDINNLKEDDKVDYHAQCFIELGLINAMLAPTKIIDKYFNMFNNHIKDEKITNAVISSMDQWSAGFIAVWDYSMYEADTKLLIYSYDNEKMNTDHLVSKEDKENYLYTNNKMLSKEWHRVNLPDLNHHITKENYYKYGDGAFLVHTLHQLDKTEYAMKQERDNLNKTIIEKSKPNSKFKL